MQCALKDMNEQGRDTNSNSEQSCSVKYVVDKPKLYNLQKKHGAATLSHAMYLLHSMLAPHTLAQDDNDIYISKHSLAAHR